MLLLPTTTDVLQVVTDAATPVHVHASWVDESGPDTIAPGRTNTAIAAAATTPVVASPAVGTRRNVQTLTVRNVDAALSVNVVIAHDDGITAVELHGATLAPGESLQYVDGDGFATFNALGQRQVGDQAIATLVAGEIASITAGGIGVPSQAQYDLLYASSATQLARIAGAANAVLVTNASKVPSLGQTLPNAVQDNITRVGVVTSGTWNAGIGTGQLVGTVALANGGTAAALTASNGGVVYSTATAFAVLAGTATAGQVLRSGASGAPAWSTATYPATVTVNRLLWASATNVIADMATGNDGVLITSGAGVPSISSTLPNAVQDAITRLGALATVFSDTAFGVHSISAGGTGVNSLTVRNTTAGTGNYARYILGNDATPSAAFLTAFSSTWTTSTYNVQDAFVVEGARVGGLSVVASDASGAVRFYSGGTTLRGSFDSAGQFIVNGGQNKAHAMTGTLLLNANTSGAAQGFQVDGANLASGSNAILVSVPTGWIGNILQATLNLVSKFSVSQAGTINGIAYTANGTAGVSAGSFATITAITATGGIVTQLTGTSDARLKNITGIYQRGLRELLQVRPQLWHWNERSGFPRDQTWVGFIAQDLQYVIPEALGSERWDDGSEWLTLNDRAILAAAVNATRELHQRLEAVEAEMRRH